MVRLKPKLNEKLLEEAIGLIANGATNKDVCNYIGVAESTFYRWLKEPRTDLERKLGEELKRAESRRRMWCLKKIYAAADSGSWQAAAWYLERRYPNEYARTQRITGEVITTQRSDALTEAIKETARKMERGRSEP